MMKRELIDRNSLFIPSDENEYEELVQFADDVMNAEVVTEQEIVKPYLAKILNNIVDDDYLRKNMSGEVWERVEDIVSNILSEDGDEE